MKQLIFIAVAVVVVLSSWLVVSSPNFVQTPLSVEVSSQEFVSEATSLNDTNVSEVPFGGPEGFIPPPLHPAGIEFEIVEFSDGVYGLLSGDIAVDNVGFVVGDDGALVVDSHINGEMANKIISAVREVTNKPILYLVNTNYHGDHTFGNYAFPESTQIVAHRLTAENMKNFEHEKAFMLATVQNDSQVFGSSELRLPDITFEEQLSIDLGGRIVELYHFGFGNTPGDTVVYVPGPNVAWTGNLILGEGTIPFLIEGHAADYLNTIANFSRTLAVDTIVPGHGYLTTPDIFGRYLDYLNGLVNNVRDAVQQGQSLDEVLNNVSLDEVYDPGPEFAGQAFILGLHKWNVQTTYLEFSVE